MSVSRKRDRAATAPPVPDPEPAAVPAAVPWARQRSRALPQATDRKRRMVEGLPDWEPLPPGEILVRRHRQE